MSSFPINFARSENESKAFPISTILQSNVYSDPKPDFSQEIIDQATYIEIAKSQSVQWNSRSGSQTTSSQDASLDTDSYHTINVPDGDIPINVANLSIQHPRHSKYSSDKASQTQQEQQQSNSSTDNQDNTSPQSDSETTENVLTSKLQSIYEKLCASHPFFTFVSDDDQIYLRHLLQQTLLSWQKFCTLKGFNPTQHVEQFLKPAETTTTLQHLQQTAESAANYFNCDAIRGQLVSPTKHPFPPHLSLFQLHGLSAIMQNHSLLVTAHTGSGKTMAAHALIFHILAQGGRVVYTSPIKALSNQKYAELSRIYSSVGLLTGDMKITPEANIVVMTTEILRNQTIHGASKFNAVIFDEVHYLSDASRGVIWEETILTLPPSTQMVFLSASVSNGEEFSKWIVRVSGRPCDIVGTHFRVVPIAHLTISPHVQNAKAGGGAIRPNNTLATCQFYRQLPPAPKNLTFQPPSPNITKILSQIQSVLETAIAQHLLPLICFAFVRKTCDAVASSLVNSLDICVTTENERDYIEQTCQKLLPDDIPDRDSIITMLKSGVAVHHSGLLPRVRELVEMLLETSHIKILFATETFAVGINVPVRSVVFSSFAKWDGTDTRVLTQAEYTQMAGRAGRRGHDLVGIAFMVNTNLTPEIYSSLVCGQPLQLESRFRISVGLLLSSFKTARNTLPQMSISDTNNNTFNTDGEEITYSLQQVINSSFAIFRFLNNNTNVANAMFIRGVLLFVQFAHRIMLSATSQQTFITSKRHPDIDALAPWINLTAFPSHPDHKAQYSSEESKERAELIKNIVGLKIGSLQLIHYVLDDHAILVYNDKISIPNILRWFFTPRTLLILQIQSLYLMAAHGIAPVISASTLLDRNNSQTETAYTILAQFLLQEKQPTTDAAQNQKTTTPSSVQETETFAFSRLLDHIAASHVNTDSMHIASSDDDDDDDDDHNHGDDDDNDDNTYADDTTVNSSNNEAQVKAIPNSHENDDDDDENDVSIFDQYPSMDDVTNEPTNNTTQTTSQPEATTTTTGPYLDQRKESRKMRDLVAENIFNPNDIINYCIPGRCVYIEFPLHFHNSDVTKFPLARRTLLDMSVLSEHDPHPDQCQVIIPNTLGWGVILGARQQYKESMLLDVLIPVPFTPSIGGPKKYALECITVCECSIAKISSILVHFSSNVASYDSYAEIWLAMLTAMHATQQTTHHTTNVDSLTTVSDFIMNNGDFSNIGPFRSKLPLLWSRPASDLSHHTDIFHRRITTLFPETPSINKSMSSPFVPPEMTDSRVQSIAAHIGFPLFSLLQGLPRPISMLLSLLLDGQAGWLCSTIERYQKTLDLAATSFNNPASTELTESSPSASTLEQTSVASDGISSSLNTIIAQYLKTVKLISIHLLSLSYIRPILNAPRIENLPTQEILLEYKLTDKGILCSYLDNPNAVLITELLFDNHIQKLSPPLLAGAISIFVSRAGESKSFQHAELSTVFSKIESCKQILVDLARQSARAGAKPADIMSLLFDEREFGAAMADAVVEWCHSHDVQKAMEVMSNTNAYAGELGRVLHRLLDLAERIVLGFEAIGNTEFQSVMQQVSEQVRQGVFFLGSLEIDQLQQSNK